MKVLITQNARIFGSGSRNVEAGELLELDDAEAADLINSGNAEAVLAVQSSAQESVPSVEVFATQAALDHAAALGIDLASIQGTGKDGKVTKADVEAAVAAKESA